MKNRPLRNFTDDECADIAIARLNGLLGNEHAFTPMRDLVLQFLRVTLEDRPSARFTIKNAIQRACQKNLIEVRKTDKTLVPPATDTRLRDDLLSKYGLQEAVVIRTPQSVDDDAVHRSLGVAMAEFISTKAIFQTDNVVGVGSGRGVQMTIRALMRPGRHDRMRAQNVKLMSLTGCVYSSPKPMTKSMWFDSDAHARQLADAFDARDTAKEATPYLISHPLAYWNEKDLQNARKRVWLGGDKSVSKLTHMLVGVGTFTNHPMHRFYAEAIATSETDRERFLEPIHDELVKLKKQCDKAKARLKAYPDYSPVAEMSNVFFFVPPPRGVTIPNQTVILQHVETINSRLLTVKAPQIRATQLIVVAGPKRKAHALRALLDAPAEYPVKYLCTTADTAREILSERA